MRRRREGMWRRKGMRRRDRKRRNKKRMDGKSGCGGERYGMRKVEGIERMENTCTYRWIQLQAMHTLLLKDFKDNSTRSDV